MRAYFFLSILLATGVPVAATGHGALAVARVGATILPRPARLIDGQLLMPHGRAQQGPYIMPPPRPRPCPVPDRGAAPPNCRMIEFSLL